LFSDVRDEFELLNKLVIQSENPFGDVDLHGTSGENPPPLPVGLFGNI
jgi:hypothetical protein